MDLGTVIENEEDIISIIENNYDKINHIHISEPNLESIQKRELHKKLAQKLKGFRPNKAAKQVLVNTSYTLIRNQKDVKLIRILTKYYNDYNLKIKEAQKEYYAGHPALSDAEFDKLWDDLKNLYPDSELLSEVGSDLEESEGFEKVELKSLMGSQNKANTAEEMEKLALETEQHNKTIIMQNNDEEDNSAKELDADTKALLDDPESMIRLLKKRRGI